MYKVILNTIFTKTISYFFSFFFLILTTQYLGASGRGIASIITASVGMIVLLCGFIGGSSIVYLVPKNLSREFIKQVIYISFVWVIIASFAGSVTLFLIKSISWEFILHVYLLGILASLFSIGTMILLSQEKIQIFNLSGLVQIISGSASFAIIKAIFGISSVESFIASLYVSYLSSISFTYYYVYKIYNSMYYSGKLISYLSTLKNISKYGFLAQMGSFVQYLNYRISYFMLLASSGFSAVGIYSVGVILSETIWVASSSIALVLYSKIANSNDAEYSRKLTIRMSKLSFLATFILLIILLILPADIIGLIFGEGFTSIKIVVNSLSFGILSLSLGSAISHYFAGIGKYYINTIGAFIGLIITLAGNAILIPKYGYIGAGIAASMSYFINTVFLFLYFIKSTNTSIYSFCFNKSDLRITMKILKKAIGRHCM